ncbi:MAG: NAD(P)-dependent oxidoreductase [Flavobacteriales bacterium]|jgi:D-3-phosphoglycerate dehydrogenase / 2-oxoglutarate reductase
MRVLFLDTVHPILDEMLTQKGFDCIHVEEKTISEFQNELENSQGLVIRSRFPVNEEFLMKCPNLKFIARSGAGMENIDIEKCNKLGIELFNSPEGNRNSVGEHSLGLLLSLMNKLHSADKEVKSGIWDREGNRGLELDGRTVGLVGFGNNGQAFAKKLRGFDVNILAYDKYKSNFSDEFVTESTLEEIQQNGDVISFHVPQNLETIGYFNNEFLERMEKPFFLLNVSRGKVVKSEIVVKGLKKGVILGAGLDVLDYENGTFENTMLEIDSIDLKFLLNSPQTLLTPHVAGWTEESYKKLSKVLGDKILAKFST